MKDTQAFTDKPRGITRRAFLPWLITGLGIPGLMASVIIPLRRPVKSLPLTKGAGLNPRFRPHNNVAKYIVKAAPGFYLHKESQVIHYLPIATFSKEPPENRFQPKDPTEIPIDSSKAQSKLRVDLSRAAYYYEQAAVAQIKQNNIDKACGLLIHAIQYELQSAYRASRMKGFRPYNRAPSVRLYDLLAGISVRFNKADYLTRMIETIESAKDTGVKQRFKDRLLKWRDPQGRWYQRWSNHSKQIKWTVDKLSGLVLLM